MTLAQARDARTAALQRVNIGEDPTTEIVARKTADNFGTLAKKYLTEHAQKKKRSWKSDERILRTVVLPTWKHLLVTDLRPSHVRDLLATVNGKTFPNRVRSCVSKVLAFAVEEGMRTTNPVKGTRRPGEENERDRELSDGEIGTVLADHGDHVTDDACRVSSPIAVGTTRTRSPKHALAGYRFSSAIWQIPRDTAKTKSPVLFRCLPPSSKF